MKMLRQCFVLLLLLTISSCAIKPRVDAVLINGRQASQGVQLERAGKLLQANSGTKIESGDVITTGTDENAILLLENGQVEVLMFENSQVRISSVIQDFGEVIYRIGRRFKGIFTVESEFGATATSGTIFYVSVNKDVDTRVVGIEGSVNHLSYLDNRRYRVNQRDEFVTSGGSNSERQQSIEDWNLLLERVNEVERNYRPGQEEYLVPHVLGLLLPDAQDILRKQGIRMGRPVPALGSQANATVIKATPGFGQITSSKNPVVLTYIAEPAFVPRVTGRSLSDATALLKRAGLGVGDVSYRITGRTKAGLVLSQSEPPQKKIATGSLINLQIEAESSVVPDLTRLTRQDATARLRQNGLDVGRIREELSTSHSSSVVLYQSPAVGSRVEPNSTVEFTVSVPAAVVPNVQNLTLRRAESVLKKGRFWVQTKNRTGRGKVIRQEPPYGTVLQKGSPVILIFDVEQTPNTRDLIIE